MLGCAGERLSLSHVNPSAPEGPFHRCRLADPTARRFQEILDSPIEFHPLATDALTGESTNLHESIHDQASLRLHFEQRRPCPS